MGENDDEMVRKDDNADLFKSEQILNKNNEIDAQSDGSFMQNGGGSAVNNVFNDGASSNGSFMVKKGNNDDM